MTSTLEEQKEEDNALSQLTKNLHDSLEIKDRNYMLKTYKSCFVANEAIDWLVKNEESIKTRNDAIELCQLLMRANIIYGINGDNTFKDNTSYYKFSSDNNENDKNNSNISSLNDNKFMLKWSHIIPGLFDRKDNNNMNYQAFDNTPGKNNKPNNVKKVRVLYLRKKILRCVLYTKMILCT